VDRQGILAGRPGEFEPDLEKKLEARLPDLLTGKPAPGRVVWTIEKSPPDFGVLWRDKEAPIATAMSVAPSGKGRPAEIGLLSEGRLTRYSPSGELLGGAPLEGKDFYYLRGADLDGDGKSEWIAGGEDHLKVVDSSGEAYWQYYTARPPLRVADVADLDGNGTAEILIQDASSLIARTALAANLWKTLPLGYVRSVVPDPLGGVLVQTPEGTQSIDRAGQARLAAPPTRGLAVLKGRIEPGDGGSLDLFGPAYGADVDLMHDFDGDGRKDIFVAARGGVSVYALDGSPLLLMNVTGSLTDFPAAIADLDGRPGDEIILDVPQYGLVALGSPAAAARGAAGKN
jgi:hypothetical protein